MISPGTAEVPLHPPLAAAHHSGSKKARAVPDPARALSGSPLYQLMHTVLCSGSGAPSLPGIGFRDWGTAPAARHVSLRRWALPHIECGAVRPLRLPVGAISGAATRHRDRTRLGNGKEPELPTPCAIPAHISLSVPVQRRALRPVVPHLVSQLLPAFRGPSEVAGKWRGARGTWRTRRSLPCRTVGACSQRRRWKLDLKRDVASDRYRGTIPEQSR